MARRNDGARTLRQTIVVERVDELFAVGGAPGIGLGTQIDDEPLRPLQLMRIDPDESVYGKSFDADSIAHGFVAAALDGQHTTARA